WSGEGVLSLAAMSGSLPGAAVEELSGQVTIDTGPITRSQLEHWLTANDRLAMFAAALAQAEIEVALGANRITFPGSTQAEWLTASLKKPPIPTSSAAPLTGILSAR